MLTRLVDVTHRPPGAGRDASMAARDQPWALGARPDDIHVDVHHRVPERAA
jgi:hypothetical protein